jgi:hypothetical protein
MFKGVKDCDTEFVGVALQSTSTLVTVDQRLKSEIKKDTTVSHCKCVTVEEEYYKHIITIPQKLLKDLDWDENTELRMKVECKKLVIEEKE